MAEVGITGLAVSLWTTEEEFLATKMARSNRRREYYLVRETMRINQ
jgi:hypothetical protein